jgi:1-acyl-sn-glycerol-3-phosphate acyltransferase
MTFIRSLLFLVYLIVYTPLHAVFCFITFPFLNPHRRFWVAAAWTKITLWVASWLVGIRWKYEGWDHIEAAAASNKPIVLLSKHQSAWETLAFPATMPRPLCYVFKRELLYVPFFGWALGMLKMVHINRKDGANAFASVARQGKERMADGAWMIMFPEGTRTPVGAPNPRYKSGGARFAVDTGAWVLPIALNSGRLWPRNAFLKHPGLITVSVGPAISSAGKTSDQLNREVQTWIETEMRRIDADSYREPA